MVGGLTLLNKGGQLAWSKHHLGGDYASCPLQEPSGSGGKWGSRVSEMEPMDPSFHLAAIAEITALLMLFSGFGSYRGRRAGKTEGRA